MQTNTPFSHPQIAVPSSPHFPAADRSWVQEDRAQSMMILRACITWISAILGAVLLTLLMTVGAFAAEAGTMPFAGQGWAAMVIVAAALVAAMSLTIYMVKDTAQRVPARKRRNRRRTD